eukprot:gene4023-8012_t
MIVSNQIGSLQSICIENLIRILEQHQCHPKLINDICKWLPDHLLEPIFYHLVEKKVLTDVTLIQFLIPSRSRLHMRGTTNIMNSTLKQIGYNCPNLISLDLSDCSQVCNAVVREILHGCPNLSTLTLDRCYRVTDAAFDIYQSPFAILHGCSSLQSISLQACPQILGNIFDSLNKNCHKLEHLNLSQCKNIIGPMVPQIFLHHGLKSLNLSFVESINDESFHQHQINNDEFQQDDNSSSTSMSMAFTDSLIYALNMSHSSISDISIKELIPYYGGHCDKLEKISMIWCPNMTDISLKSLEELSSLKSVCISGCSNISEEGIATLKTHNILVDI